MRIDAKSTDLSTDDDNLEPRLMKIFAERNIPVGLIYRLLLLTEFKGTFLVDDSLSMNTFTDVTIANATQQVQNLLRSGKVTYYLGAATDPGKSDSRIETVSRVPVDYSKPDTKISRWHEAQSRIHRFIDLFGHVPTKDIAIKSLSGKRKLVLSRKDKSAEEFIRYAHAAVCEFFSTPPSWESTPVHSALSKEFKECTEKTMIYLFGDGKPTQEGFTESQAITNVKALIEGRANPSYSPLELISCTSVDEDTAWMKEMDEKAPNVGESDDDVTEAAEMRKNHGPGFPIPISQAFLDLCALLAPICPDLDALDEPVPLTKYTIENILNQKISNETYRSYWDQNRNARKFELLYSEFLNTPKISAIDIIEKIKLVCGLAKKDEVQAHHVLQYVDSSKKKLASSTEAKVMTQSTGVATQSIFTTSVVPQPAVTQVPAQQVQAAPNGHKDAEEAPKGCACAIL